MMASDIRPVGRPCLGARRRLLSPARADETTPRRRAEVVARARGAIVARRVAERQTPLDDALAKRGI
jgi:hypothetical protein